MKIIEHENEETLLVFTNRLHKFFAGTQNFNEINFRILRIPVEKAKANTVCDVRNNIFDYYY